MEKENKRCCEKSEKWYNRKIFLAIEIVFLLVFIDLTLLYFNIKILHPFILSFYDYVKMIWLAILIGILIGGLINYFIPSTYISKYLAHHRKRTIFYSVGLGFLMSACSHGILAISMALYKKGASTPAIISFLLASPWANLPITIILFSFFNLKAIFFIISAIIIAITTGLIYQWLDKKGLVECDKHQIKEKDFSILKDIKKRLRGYKFSVRSLKIQAFGVLKSSIEVSEMVLWWIIIGMLLASLTGTFVPKEIFMRYMGPTFLGLFVTLILATILEVCSEGTAPLAFEIYKQTNAFGNSFTFLNAGVATDYTEIGLIYTNIGKKAALFLPIITVPQILFFGYLFNLFL